MERRLAAILAADVQGYSHLTELNEEASTATLRMHRAVVEESISAHRGHVFSSGGDGVVAEFPSVVEAIRCAVEIQNEIAERNSSVPEKQQMQFRIGVNLGDVIAEDNNLYGTGVNVAVRLEQLAEPGGICLSQTVYDQVRKIVEIPSRTSVSTV
jgi:LysR family glycine cleavage system transcriptional activator